MLSFGHRKEAQRGGSQIVNRNLVFRKAKIFRKIIESGSKVLLEDN